MWSLRSFSVRFLWSEVVWWGLPCGSWSCWSASSRCWGEDRTPPPRSAQRFRFPLPGRRSGRQAPPRRSSDEAEKIKKNTRHRIPSRNCCFLFLFSHHMLSTKAKTKKEVCGVFAPAAWKAWSSRSWSRRHTSPRCPGLSRVHPPRPSRTGSPLTDGRRRCFNITSAQVGVSPASGLRRTDLQPPRRGWCGGRSAAPARSSPFCYCRTVDTCSAWRRWASWFWTGEKQVIPLSSRTKTNLSPKTRTGEEFVPGRKDEADLTAQGLQTFLKRSCRCGAAVKFPPPPEKAIRRGLTCGLLLLQWWYTQSSLWA